MKKTMNILLAICTVIISATANAGSRNAGPRVVLSEDQAKSIAVIHLRKLNAKDDILTVIRENIEPEYSVSSIEHLGYDVYQVDVRTMRPGQTCQQRIIINDSNGKLEAKQSASCE